MERWSSILKEETWQPQTWHIMLVKDGIVQSPKGKRQKRINCRCHCMGMRVWGDHIHVNSMEDWLHESRVSHSIELLYGCMRDRLVNREEGQYDLQVSHHRWSRSMSKMKDIDVATLGWRVKMDCSIPINSIPRCSVITEGWERWKKNKREKTTLRVEHVPA